MKLKQYFKIKSISVIRTIYDSLFIPVYVLFAFSIITHMLCNNSSCKLSMKKLLRVDNLQLFNTKLYKNHVKFLWTKKYHNILIYNKHFEPFNNLLCCEKNLSLGWKLIGLLVRYESINLHCNISCIIDLVPLIFFLRISKIQIIICRCWHKSSDRTCCFKVLFYFLKYSTGLFTTCFSHLVYCSAMHCL